jgi:5'-nucleotidase
MAALYAAFSIPKDAGAQHSNITKLTILHTNDVHSNIEPFPSNHSKFPDRGGVAYRKTIIDKIRAEEKNVLLLDAGDIFQGTPYFNVFHGETEIKLMTALGYDACTIGNHDFDGGMENLALQAQYAIFPMLNCNYGLQGTPLQKIIKPYAIFHKGGLKIGITGVGVNPKGLIPDNLCKGVTYNDPVVSVQEVADYLSVKEKCNLVICLSHLGYEYSDDKISDVLLAAHTEHIDIIIGGHTHTFLEKPTQVINKAGEMVLVNQVGWAGINLGRIEVFFEKKSKKKSASGYTVIVDKKTSG